MFETEEFRKRIDTSVSATAFINDMEYEPRIVSFLQSLAMENEGPLMERELRKSASERRGIPEALISVRELTRVASGYAVADRRKTITTGDIERALKTKFCQVWPFCRSYERESER